MNSFKSSGEGLNFAVSVVDVISFLDSAKQEQSKAEEAECKPARLYDGRNQDDNGGVVHIDTNCDSMVDFYVSTLDDLSKPISAFVDSNFDGKVDIVVEDTERDGRWDVSLHDADYDGNVDLVGYHPDGEIRPSRFEKYASTG